MQQSENLIARLQKENFFTYTNVLEIKILLLEYLNFLMVLVANGKGSHEINECNFRLRSIYGRLKEVSQKKDSTIISNEMVSMKEDIISCVREFQVFYKS